MFVPDTFWRITVGLALWMVAVIAAQAHGQDPSTPYRASVSSSTALVRSGPGKVHYPTQQLKSGATVEVYRHDPGGWLAIRPPEGSFSLIQADKIKLVEGGELAQVQQEGARSWVGTRLNPVDQPMWQVQLKPGELLQVLGQVDRERFDLGDDQPDWIQIAPPSGEFRWIHEDDLDLGKTKSLQSESAESANEKGSGSSSGISSVPVSESWDTTDLVESKPRASEPPSSSVAQSSGWKPATRPIETLVSQRSEFVADTKMIPRDDTNWGTSGAVPIQTASLETPSFSDPPTSVSQAPVESPPAVQHLEIMLTRQLLNPPNQWELAGIADMAARLKQQSYDPQIQAAAERIIAKIRRCREIQAGYRAADQLAAGTNPGAGAVRGTNTAGSEFHTLYDAHGWLSELIREGGRGASGFVLQDKDGRVTHHVAAPPGLNLRRYLNQRVGIIGNRGYHSQLKLDHVTAERVIVIDTLRR